MLPKRVTLASINPYFIVSLSFFINLLSLTKIIIKQTQDILAFFSAYLVLDLLIKEVV